MTTTRRAWLRAGGAGALATALLPFVPRGARPARAAGRPSNLVLVFHPNGLEPGWQPVGGETDFKLGPVLAPLEKFRSRLTIVGGIQGGIRNEVQGHAQGMTSLWTGSQIKADGDLAQHASFDQLVAERTGAGTLFRSLEFGVQSQPTGKIDNGTVMIYAGPGKPLQAEDDPNRMFDRIFGAATGDPAALEKARREKKSVLDLVRGQLADIRSFSGTDDRRILDQHAAQLNAIEARLGGLGKLTCDHAFTKHNKAGDLATKQSALFPEMAKLQTDLLVMALGCGLTRVASLQFTNSTSATQIPGVNPQYGIHTVMHTRPKEEKVKINQWFVGQLVSLLETLDAQPLPDGGTLLDDTVVVWGSEMALGNHLNSPVPFIIAGGTRGGVLKQGRWMDLASRPRHTRLLMTVMRVLGIEDVTTLGDLTGDNDRDAIKELLS